MSRMNIVNWPRFTGICPRCGRPTNEGARFCRACGQRLVEDAPVQNVANRQAQASKPAPTPTSPDEPSPQAPQQNAGSALDWRVVAFVAGLTAVIGLIIRSLIRMFV